MLAETQLDELLHQWAREYGYGGLPSDRSWNIIQTLIDHEGFVPNSRGYIPVPMHSAADEVDKAIKAMQNKRTAPGTTNPYYRSAMVLRVEYLMRRDWPISERLERLRHIGLQMSKATYYRMLEFARDHLREVLYRKRKKLSIA